MNFVAIDFETANGYRNSACSVGIAIVKYGEVIHSEARYINPPDDYFSPRNIAIHGIMPDDVADAPTMGELWNRWLCDIVSNQVLVAHNVAFDRSVLKNSLECYNVKMPDLEFFCTYKMAKYSLDLHGYSLPVVCDHFGLSVDHHKAESDAVACAKIAIEFCKQANTVCLLDLVPSLPVATTAKYRHYETKPKPSVQAKSNSSLAGLRFVFTGAIDISRQEAIDSVKNRGGMVTPAVSRKTDYLVVGDNLFMAYKRKGHTTKKLRAAIQFQEDGMGIQIISGFDFFGLLN